jgi:hypothetical protein
MSQSQAATNAAAIRNLADRLERAGWAGDPQAEAEAICRQLLDDGFAPIRRPEPIPARGTGGSPQARAEALAATAAAVARAKAAHGDDPASQPAATPRQLTRLAILLSEDGIRDRQARLDWASAMAGRTLTSSTELTRAEAGRLIDALEAPPLPAEPPAEQVTA